ncbi:MAG: BrnT family toxin [Actinomycetota bacterium]
MRIDELFWDEDNEEHIAAHGVTIEEVEAAIFDRASIALRTTGPSGQPRQVFLGQSDAGRYLFIVLEPVHAHLSRPVTARDMTDGEKTRYKRRGDEMEKHIPRFGSREEEAKFWAETGIEDLASGQVEEAEIERPERPSTTTFAVRLDRKTVSLLREVAKAYNLGVTQLVRSWMLERLKLEQQAGVLAHLRYAFPADFELAVRKKVVQTAMAHVVEIAEGALEELGSRFESEVELTREGCKQTSVQR